MTIKAVIRIDQDEINGMSPITLVTDNAASAEFVERALYWVTPIAKTENDLRRIDALDRSRTYSTHCKLADAYKPGAWLPKRS
jgi:hypothetical protein